MKAAPHTKAYYKERWRQLEASGLKIRLQRVTSNTDNVTCPMGKALPPCFVIVERLTEEDIARHQRQTERERYCPITSPISSVIEISSDEECEAPPPRCSSNPTTPSPIVSVEEYVLAPTSPPIYPEVLPTSSSLLGEPVSQFHTSALDVADASQPSDIPPYSPISSESIVGRVLPESSSQSLTSEMSLYTTSPSAASSTSTRNPSEMTSPGKAQNEDEIFVPLGTPFQCRTQLSAGTVAQLEPFVQQALAVHRPHSRYKRVVFLPDGQAFRIYINRRGDAIVIPRERRAV